MTVKALLRAAFSLILMGAVAIGLISVAQIWRVGNTAALIYTEGFASNRTVETIRASVLRASRAQEKLLSAATARERDDATEEISRNIQVAATAVAKMKRSPDEADVVNSAQQSELVNLVESWSQQLQTFEKLIDDQPLYHSKMSWQVALLETSIRAETDKLEQAVNRLALGHEQNTNAAIAQATSIYHSSLGEVLALTLVLVVVTVAGNEWVIRRLARSLGGEPDYARSIAARIAQGDLSECVDVDAGASNSLLSALSDMQDGLCSMVKRIATGSATMSEASAEISQGNRDLATRTENQAFKIEQATSGMEVIAATVQQNAQRSSTASGLAVDASAVAAKGGVAVDALVDTIEEVNAGSRDISDIISVIDGIAFQTNILALNAAVEAARAGDAGRGFSVVAAEVRSLSQRSSASAREIKQILQATISRVSDGFGQACEAGATMKQVVLAIDRVRETVEAISAATAEQSLGIAAMANALRDIDAGTQQNAALVEQAAAAAAALDNQAQILRNLVSGFRTSVASGRSGRADHSQLGQEIFEVPSSA
ncbi:methyl-accepting chemotaxis protein [Paraburkholderia domus]|uniref:methyl-accepting chemotaxis protein n=1 Tax=Paraburkholderia domus TaxID=2793075 RepID=UPI001B8D157A|nr:methyl-accepting chemotaxis protein [Paraburkholderia domus]